MSRSNLNVMVMCLLIRNLRPLPLLNFYVMPPPTMRSDFGRKVTYLHRKLWFDGTSIGPYPKSRFRVLSSKIGQKPLF